MTDASKVLDDAKYSGTKEVDESLQIDAAKLQPWIDAYIPNAGKITAIEQFKGGQSNPTYKIITDKKSCPQKKATWKTSSICSCCR